MKATREKVEGIIYFRSCQSLSRHALLLGSSDRRLNDPQL